MPRFLLIETSRGGLVPTSPALTLSLEPASSQGTSTVMVEIQLQSKPIVDFRLAQFLIFNVDYTVALFAPCPLLHNWSALSVIISVLFITLPRLTKSIASCSLYLACLPRLATAVIQVRVETNNASLENIVLAPRDVPLDMNMRWQMWTKQSPIQSSCLSTGAIK